MGYTKDDLTEAKRQIDSTLHKLREMINTSESKKDTKRCKSQLTLAKRRVKAFEVANWLIEKELAKPGYLETEKSQGDILVISGSPGTGKTTTASIIASNLIKSVNLHTDDFYHYLCGGAIPPHLPESEEQNFIVIEAFLETAKRFARGGYDVIVDGIVGPWFLEPWIKAARDGYMVHYIILRASKDETMKRAIGRMKLDQETNMELVDVMWEQFHHLERYEANVINTTNQSIEQTVAIIMERVQKKINLLGG